MAKTRTWTCLSLLSLMVPFWSSLLSVDGHIIQTVASGPAEIEHVDDEKAPAKRFRDARLYIEARYRGRDGRIRLRMYMCLQQPLPVTIYCFKLDLDQQHDAYRRANFYFVSGVHKRPAWGIFELDRYNNEVPFALPSQFMLGVHPKDKLIDVFDNICDDFNFHKEQSEYLLDIGLLAPGEEFDGLNEYFCINDLNVFRTSFAKYAQPCHSAYVEAVWKTMRAFNDHMEAQQKMDRNIARRGRRASTELQRYSRKKIHTWEDLRFAMLYLAEKLIDPCMVAVGDGYGTWPIEGFADSDASRLCRFFCKAIGITAYLRSRDPQFETNHRWNICTRFHDRGECLREGGYGRCWCDFTTDAGDEAKKLLIWCHNHVRSK